MVHGACVYLGFVGLSTAWLGRFLLGRPGFVVVRIVVIVIVVAWNRGTNVHHHVTSPSFFRFLIHVLFGLGTTVGWWLGGLFRVGCVCRRVGAVFLLPLLLPLLLGPHQHSLQKFLLGLFGLHNLLHQGLFAFLAFNEFFLPILDFLHGQPVGPALSFALRKALQVGSAGVGVKGDFGATLVFAFGHGNNDDVDDDVVVVVVPGDGREEIKSAVVVVALRRSLWKRKK